MEFALTGSDDVLRSRIFSALTPEEFIALVNKEIDLVKLTEVVAKTREERLNKMIRYGAGVYFTSVGVVFFSNVWTAEVSGQQIPEDAIIIPDELSFEQDVDLTLPPH